MVPLILTQTGQTRREITHHRDLRFNDWVRNNLPSSWEGYWVTDIDFVLFSNCNKKIMLLEVKTRNKIPAPWQSYVFEKLARWIKKGIEFDIGWEFMGMHYVKFENTFFDDGKIYLDDKEILEESLRIFLSF